MKRILGITTLGLCLMLAMALLTACSLTAPRNVRQEGWYLRWEQPPGFLASEYLAQVRRTSDTQWQNIPLPPPPLKAGELNLQNLYLQDGDQIRIQLWKYGSMHNVRTSRWVTITFRIPD